VYDVLFVANWPWWVVGPALGLVVVLLAGISGPTAMRSARLSLTLLLVLVAGISYPVATSRATNFDDLLWDLQIVPLDSEPAPAFTLPTIEGHTLSLTDLRGRVVMLYFWKTT
jgi:cytochrome oxidase Cu insertion factor (SCO1/SenC/PrrC family)